MTGPDSVLTLLPAIDVAGGRAVLHTRRHLSDGARPLPDPLELAVGFVEQGAGWLHVVDLDAALDGRPRNRDLITAIADATGAAVQASGGVRSLDDVRDCVSRGARRVVLATGAVADTTLVSRTVDEFGDAIAVALDCRGRTLRGRGEDGELGDLLDTAHRLAALGVTRFVHTDVDRGGSLRGPALESLVMLADATGVAVTASGGISSIDDLRAVAACHPAVDAAIIGTALHTGSVSLGEALEVTAGQGRG